ncbi:MAG: (Fe-S)-binding protein, partial [Chloroflexota bacterium]|nr:(Fe-S)-binding protein [Chloroflexota bacterium]
VEVPQQAICCGRPLYDFGMLNLAKHILWQVIVTMRSQIEAGIPIVGLEPSCVAVFRDELINLFPHDQDAKRLSQQTYLLSEFLEKEATDFQVPQLHAKALVHGHCHHKAIMKMKDEEKLLSKLGLDFQVLDSGCCGMAGAFGFEQAHYDVSMKVGERVLLPAVRNAAQDTLIIANGFSCREQIVQTTERRALHLAEVLQMALHKQTIRPDETTEASYTQLATITKANSPSKVAPTLFEKILLIVVIGMVGSGIIGWLLQRKKGTRK